MTLNPVIDMLGRRLRLAVIGGGPGSFIGAMHRQAARLDDRYEIDGQTAWRPLWVANDGHRTYLKMPPTLHTTEAPALFVQTTGGSNALQNYRIKGNFYVVDGVFQRAVLTTGSGPERQIVTITRGGQ